MSVVQQYLELFRGRGDAYGSWEGRSIREPVTPHHFEKHLTSTSPKDWIGVYPNLGEHVSWGCIDIDGADFPKTESVNNPNYDRKNPTWHNWSAMHDLATRLVDALAYKNVHGHIEKTRNGYHIWVFPDQPLIEASTMRRALMAACKVCNYNPKEVNPKSEIVKPGKLGNYVRLPYHGALSNQPPTPKERHFITHNNEQNIIHIEQFVQNVQRTPVNNLRTISKLWTPPTTSFETNFDAGLEAQPIVRHLPGLAYTIWRDGPLQGKDRSSTLTHLAHLCAEHNITPKEAFVVVKSADERHGRKFAERADGEEQIAKIVTHAYSQIDRNTVHQP